MEVGHWSSCHGHNDPKDRQFYPTPSDIKYIISRFRAQGRADENNATSVDRLLKTELCDSVVFYQPLSKESKQPLLIILQSPYQRQKAEDHGKNLVFIDATYSSIFQG